MRASPNIYSGWRDRARPVIIAAMIDIPALLAALPARIDAIPRSACARMPDAPALVDAGRTLTYRDLAALIDRRAAQ